MRKIHQIEDKRDKRTERKGEADRRTEHRSGLASSFSEQEVKNLFFSYLTTMLLVEGLIFFFSFINHLATDGSPFPWKPYLFATFITPIAITFVFGLILLTFNRFFFSRPAASADGSTGLSFSGSWEKGERVATFLQLIHRLPLLFSLFLLITATALAYKLEDIVIYIAEAGATTARYLFFTLIGVLVIAAIGVALWVFLSYRLKNKTLTSEHEYRMQLIERFGMVLLEDGTMLDRQGKIVYRNGSAGELGPPEGAEDLPRLEEIRESRPESD
jgi:hypothetical protein